MKTLATRMTNEWVPALATLAPQAGCYLSEVIPTEHSFTQAVTVPISQLIVLAFLRLTRTRRTGRKTFTAPITIDSTALRRSTIRSTSFTPQPQWAVTTGRCRRMERYVGLARIKGRGFVLRLFQMFDRYAW